MKTIVGIFAHPDDEAFGPGGTIAKLAQTNTVYLICITKGDWNNGKRDVSLGITRRKELEESANVLGVKKVIFLEYHDGTLCNNLYHTIADSIKMHLQELRPEQLITLEPRGVSGHLDHVAISMITTFVFQKLSFIKELWYFCMNDKFNQYLDNYFIYFPPGYNKDHIDKVINVSQVWDTKIAAILKHNSQIKDVEIVLKALQMMPKEEYFLLKKRL